MKEAGSREELATPSLGYAVPPEPPGHRPFSDVISDHGLTAALDAACGVVVRELGLRLAWIALPEPGLERVIPLACSEPGARYLVPEMAAEGLGPSRAYHLRCGHLTELPGVKALGAFPARAGPKTLGLLGVGAEGPDVLAARRDILEAVAQQVAVILERRLRGREAGDAFLCVIEGLARAAEANEEDAARHIVRVGEYAAELARALNLPNREVQTIRLAARVHDVGKLHVPREILLKPGPLSEAERIEMQRHTLYGARILAGAPGLAVARQTALFHHECWDGSGYPYGLQGEKIPLPARIVRLADVYDALRSSRVYKPPLDHATAYRIILEGDERTRPTQFDPRVLKAFRQVAGRLAEIFESGWPWHGEEP
jgi:hypothetical protein